MHTPLPYCIPLRAAIDEGLVGGKARNLQRLITLGIPVPDGFVVTNQALAAACRGRAGATPLQDAVLPAAVIVALEASYSTLSAARVIVRSSAAGEDSVAASFAGQLDSVPGVTTREELRNALMACWRSRCSDRVRAYERARGVRLSGMGAIVQRQVDAVISGVLFTAVPSAGPGMLLEYCEGMGEALVSGRVNPGRITLSRAGTEWRLDAPPEERFESERLLLCDRMIAEVARTARTIEDAFGVPQDIEWTIDGEGALWIVQARPITTSAPLIVWSNANVNENFPAPICPLLYSVASAGYYHYFRNLGRAFGLSRSRLAAIDHPLRHIIGVHGARMYYNLTNIHTALRAAPFGEQLAAAFNQFVGASEITARHAPAASRTAGRLRQTLEVARIAAATAWQYLFLTRRVERFERTADVYAAATRAPFLAVASRRELLDRFRGFLDIRCHRWTNASLADAASMVCYAVLRKLLARAFPERDQHALHNTLLKALPGLVSSMPSLRLWELSRAIRADEQLSALFAEKPAADVLSSIRHDERFRVFNSALNAYLEDWGFRCSAELMLTVPCFQEDPAPLVDILRAYAAIDSESPAELLARQEHQRCEQTTRVLGALRGRPVSRWLPFVRESHLVAVALAWTHTAIQLRERARLKQALLYSRFRQVALAIGERLTSSGQLQQRDEIFLLTAGEIDALLAGTEMFPHHTQALVRLRSDAFAQAGATEPPDTVRLPEGEYLPLRSRRRPESSSQAAESPDLLCGTGACGGQATARAAVLQDVTDAHRLLPGDVLVTRQTDPGWGPVFPLISGLVIERGGMLSHGAIIAREFGIPSVVGVVDATIRIPDGSQICVDGDLGTVRVRA